MGCRSGFKGLGVKSLLGVWGFRVDRVWVLGFGVQGFGVQGVGCKGLRFRVHGCIGNVLQSISTLRRFL